MNILYMIANNLVSIEDKIDLITKLSAGDINKIQDELISATDENLFNIKFLNNAVDLEREGLNALIYMSLKRKLSFAHLMTCMEFI